MPNQLSIMFSMNKLNTQKRAQILGMLVEGNSLRAISRMADVSINTVTKLLIDAGCAAAKFHDEQVRNLTCQRVQCDEIWSFCYAKAKNVKAAKSAPDGAGDIWTWTSLDADTKLMCNWLIGNRNLGSAMKFMEDLRSRLSNRVQLTTDGHNVYMRAVDYAFGEDIDYAQLVKRYGNVSSTGQARYSPAECVGCKKTPVQGNPAIDHVNTSYVERANLTMRMGMRRFTRLTNGFSKKVENHAHAVALHVMHYNFLRVHKTLKKTPAMAAGLTDRVWTLQEIAGLMDTHDAPKKRGPYKKRISN